MAAVGKSARASMDMSQALTARQISGDLYAGENLNVAAPCYIGTDGKVYQSSGAAAGAAALVRGWTAKQYNSGEPVTLFLDGRFKYSDGTLTPGARYYVDTAAGGLNDAATVGGTVPVAFAVSAYDIFVTAQV